ncbi:4-alpha-glucanotransferase [Pantoea latae]|uniref:4-alpha-glucanotransferase n=1 Tax=Pantoea latae TaxID=1964541 RepID=A0A1V9DP33_9GAMM|nr:4-alpha-glucanotransferase [Pantoea latae]OQP35618.1 4-alpha-glucanotransferase [Pantoea latae]
MKESALDRAAVAAGISLTYTNAKGEPEAISDDTKTALLAVMGDARQEKGAPLPPVQVFSGGAARQLEPQGRGRYQWRLRSEKGREFSGELEAGEPFTLPSPLGHGYHQLTLSKGKKAWQTRIILTPRRCWLPAPLRNGEKRWGALVQLYTVRSADNWGIGDFGDLQQLLEQVARQGGDFVGLNPLHALYPATPDFASPYSPSSRRWLNIIYISVAQLEDFQNSAAAQKWWSAAKTQRALAKARDSEFVDYAAVMALKLAALRHAWAQFSQRAEEDAQRQAFADFVRDGGDSLRYQAAYDGLQAERRAEDDQAWGWPAWPESWRSSQSPEVQRWCETHQEEIAFWQWLQWLAQTQFAQCWARSQALNMTVGLYRDLAVGVAEGSAETWHDPELYRLEASVGAPPDRLGPLGQNWGLPPMDPHVMRARGYQPFIDMLRANMRDCGALRIDHVMALLRLWWVPKGETADKGAYVSYPVQDLLGVLALESQRHRCMVIGEDLGTVPPEIVGLLRASGVFSWKVMWFEQQRDGRYRLPGDYPRQSIASASTHDLPTLSGFWNAGDFALGEKLKLYPGKAVLQSLHEQRAKQKQALLDALHQAGAMPARSARQAEKLEMTPALNLAMHKFLAATGSALLGLQPEDWIGMTTPVNVPGTVDQYPNWRRKLTQPLETIFADKAVVKLLKAVSQTRKGES